MADVFSEVDEAIRQDQFKKLWKKYGKYMIAAIVAVVVGVGGMQAWQSYELSQREESSAAFDAAVVQVASGDLEGGLAALSAQSDPAAGGFGTLAAFAEVRVLLQQNKTAEALDLLDQLAASDAAGPTFKGAAILLSVSQQLDSGDPLALTERLAPLTAADNPFRGSALELTALLALRQGDQTRAKEILTLLSADSSIPAGLQSRAQQLLSAFKL